MPKAWISRRAGGDQLDYADENPETRKLFAQELATRGLSSQMDKAYAAEKTDMAPAKIEEEEKAHA